MPNLASQYFVWCYFGQTQKPKSRAMTKKLTVHDHDNALFPSNPFSPMRLHSKAASSRRSVNSKTPERVFATGNSWKGTRKREATARGFASMSKE